MAQTLTVGPARVAAVLLGAALLAAGAVAAPADAVGKAVGKGDRSGAIVQAGAVPAGFGSWQELARVQERMNLAADRIAAAARVGETGFGGIVAAPENRALRLYWKGRPPSAIEALLTDLRHGLRIELRPARHTERELLREADRIIRRRSPGVTSVGVRPDGAGLTVTVAGSSTDAARSATRDTTVAVDIETNVVPAVTGRWNDFAPWWSGGAWRNITRGSGCSTGFAVWHEGRTKLLTAGHCGQIGDRATDPTGEHIGYVSQDNNPRDVQLIDARSEGNVYNNDVALTEFGNPVIGALGSYVGNWICTSGASSGTRCGIQVTQTGVFAGSDLGYVIGPLVVAEKADRTSAEGQGDSGGPVEQVAADPTRVYAKGTITGIDTRTVVPCTGYVTAGRLCGWRMYYVDIVTALSTFGASITLG